MRVPAYLLKTIASTLLAVTATALHAATWSVDNKSPGAADFESLSAAITAASAGDTLVIAGSPTSYGEVTFDKELHLVGPGWHHDTNFPAASPMNGAMITSITLPNATANGSSFRSLQIGRLDADDCANLLIERIAPTFETGTAYIIFNNVNDATIRQCYRISVQGNTLTSTSRNLKVYNNTLLLVQTAASESEFYHNVFLSYLINTSNATFRYNIYYGASLTLTLNNCLAEYNIIDATDGSNRDPWPGDTNLNDIPQEDIFTGGALGASYQLKQDSPAINIDGLGTNAGIYGGDHPYILSGMPAVPVVYHVDAPVTAQAGETINISFKATAEPVIEDDGPTDGPTDDFPTDDLPQ